MLQIRCAAFLAVLLPLSGAAAPHQAPVAPQTFTIGGTAVEHGSNRPLKDAVVTVAPVQHPELPLSYRTGEDGRFVFTALQPGKYTLTAKKRGFPPQSFQQNQNYSTAIAVGPGLDSPDIVFPLFAGGSITGTILDEENEPVRQAQILLFSKGVFSGTAKITMRGQLRTDSSGQFRFPSLEAGTYFVAVEARPWYAQSYPMQPQVPGAEPTSARGELDVVYPVTYYAGATDPASASALTITEGSSSNLQIVLRPVPALHVQVSGLHAPEGRPLGMTVSQVVPGGYPVFSNSQFGCNGDSCEISGIAPSRYVVSPFTYGPGNSENNASGIFDLTTDQHLDISAFHKMSLTGKITFEGSTAPPHPALSLFQPGGWMQSQISAAPDGALTLTNGALLPGRYQLMLQNAPGFFIKSVEAKGATVSAGQLDVADAGSVQLSLVAAPGSISIDGIALKDEKPFGGAMVLLIPKDFRTDLIRRDQSDSDGTFTLPDVPPGRYTLVAIDEGRELLYQDPAAMKPYLSQGKEVLVPLQSAAPIKVNVAARLAHSN